MYEAWRDKTTATMALYSPTTSALRHLLKRVNLPGAVTRMAPALVYGRTRSDRSEPVKQIGSVKRGQGQRHRSMDALNFNYGDNDEQQ